MATQFPVRGVDRVHAEFDRQLETGLHYGAQLAVYADGELVVDRADGEAIPDGPPTTPDRKHVLYSSSKAYLAGAVAKLVDDGLLSFDDRIVEYWPEFAEPGSTKAEITPRHVLSHQSGLARTSMFGSPDRWDDWDEVVAAVEDAKLYFDPGTDAAYQLLSYGWILGELIRRVYDRDLAAAMEDLVFDPLGLSETSLGLPTDSDAMPAKIVFFENPDRATELEGAFNRKAMTAIYNTPRFQQIPIPAANCMGTARDLARFFACLANGGSLAGNRYLDRWIVDEMTSVQIAVGNDWTYHKPARYALGFDRVGAGQNMYGLTASEHVFGGYGSRAHVAWADPEADVAMALVTNGMLEDYEHTLRSNMISDAVRAAFATA